MLPTSHGIFCFFLVACSPKICRVLKPHNFVAVSPSRQQVAGQAAMESIPLVFEPQSRFYTSPVVVLDFQVCEVPRYVCMPIIMENATEALPFFTTPPRGPSCLRHVAVEGLLVLLPKYTGLSF